MNFAVIENGTVTNIVVADSAEDIQFMGNVVEYEHGDSVAVGDKYNGTTFEKPESN